jgi:hypothetical protein
MLVGCRSRRSGLLVIIGRTLGIFHPAPQLILLRVPEFAGCHVPLADPLRFLSTVESCRPVPSPNSPFIPLHQWTHGRGLAVLFARATISARDAGDQGIWPGCSEASTQSTPRNPRRTPRSALARLLRKFIERTLRAKAPTCFRRLAARINSSCPPLFLGLGSSFQLWAAKTVHFMF